MRRVSIAAVSVRLSEDTTFIDLRSASSGRLLGSTSYSMNSSLSLGWSAIIRFYKYNHHGLGGITHGWRGQRERRDSGMGAKAQSENLVGSGRDSFANRTGGVSCAVVKFNNQLESISRLQTGQCFSLWSHSSMQPAWKT